MSGLVSVLGEHGALHNLTVTRLLLDLVLTLTLLSGSRGLRAAEGARRGVPGLRSVHGEHGVLYDNREVPVSARVL